MMACGIGLWAFLLLPWVMHHGLPNLLEEKAATTAIIGVGGVSLGVAGFSLMVAGSPELDDSGVLSERDFPEERNSFDDDPKRPIDEEAATRA